HRGRRAILFHSLITDDTVPILYDCLRRSGHTDRTDLVLSTVGGAIPSTRQVAMLVREFTDELSILVPYRARSAGTLLCLSADELVLGPLAELGPIDSLMGSDGAPATDTPGTISAEDIRAFRAMAEDWFGIERPEDRLQVLALLAARIFPTSLSSFYRFDKLIREVAAELLSFQLPGEHRQAERNAVVDRLVSGYHSHDAVISRRDARTLGLRAVDASPAEEELLWSLWQAVHSPAHGDSDSKEQVIGVLAGADFAARHVVHRSFDAAPDGTRPDRSPVAVHAGWEVSG
ncbi:MAG TPA: hypothetical protein VGX49_13885, partial [Jatrophihabitans sp.]|nr:hypothetical protein [Jatrophihabitans sp.]